LAKAAKTRFMAAGNIFPGIEMVGPEEWDEGIQNLINPHDMVNHNVFRPDLIHLGGTQFMRKVAHGYIPSQESLDFLASWLFRGDRIVLNVFMSIAPSLLAACDGRGWIYRMLLSMYPRGKALIASLCTPVPFFWNWLLEQLEADITSEREVEARREHDLVLLDGLIFAWPRGGNSNSLRMTDLAGFVMDFLLATEGNWATDWLLSLVVRQYPTIAGRVVAANCIHRLRQNAFEEVIVDEESLGNCDSIDIGMMLLIHSENERWNEMGRGMLERITNNTRAIWADRRMAADLLSSWDATERIFLLPEEEGDG
jgi:hypothetical protein